MERKSLRNMPSLLLWSLVTALVSQNLLFPVMSAGFEDQKNYYTPTPDPHVGTPPSGGYSPKTPSPSPSHSTPSRGSSGGSCGPTPSTPKACPTPSTPSSKSPPSGHHGGYYPSPTPTTPSTPTTPTTPTTPSTPSTPTDPNTPTTPTTPYTPSTPPYIPDPNSPPFTCTYWRNHPQLIWGVLGWWGTLGNTFGVPNVRGLGSNISLKDALSNSRTDGYGELYRQATASLLNSMVDNQFAFTTKQVRETFLAALGSNKAASAQASLFKLANEGKHPRV